MDIPDTVKNVPLSSLHHSGKPETQSGKGEQEDEVRNIGDQKGKDAAKNRRQRDIGHGSLDDEYVQAHRRSDLSDLENARAEIGRASCRERV